MSVPVVIFSSDNGELYRPFVEPVTASWKNIGFEVMCDIIDENNCYVNPEIIPYGNQSQMIRALLPALHPERTFLISDVDMLPLSKKYFTQVMRLIDNDNKIVNVSADAYTGQSRLPMCYFAGTGKAFSAVTGIKSREDISRVMTEWWKRDKGWETDEICFTEALLTSSAKNEIELSLYKRGWCQGVAIGRIDRGAWVYDKEALELGAYIDSHMLRPFTDYVEQLRPVFRSVGVEI